MDLAQFRSQYQFAAAGIPHNEWSEYTSGKTLQDALRSKEQLLKIVQEETPFSYRKFEKVGGKKLATRLENLVPDDYIVIVDNTKQEDYYRLPLQSFINLLDIYKSEIEVARNQNVETIKKRARANIQKGKRDFFLKNDNLFKILNRTREAVKIPRNQFIAESFTSIAAIPKDIPNPPPPEIIERSIEYDGVLYTARKGTGIMRRMSLDDRIAADNEEEIFDGKEFIGILDEDGELEFTDRPTMRRHYKIAKHGYGLLSPEEAAELRAKLPPKRPRSPLKVYVGFPPILMGSNSAETFSNLLNTQREPEPQEESDDEDETRPYIIDGMDYVLNPMSGEIFDDNSYVIARSTGDSYEFLDEERHKDNIREKSSQEESEEESEDDIMKIKYEGVSYIITNDFKVYDHDEYLEGDRFILGEWVNGDIKFTPDGAAAHMSDPKQGSLKDGIPKLILPINKPDWFTQSSSPEPEPEEESDDEIRIDDFPDDDEDDDEDDEDIPLRYEGVFYSIEPDMNVKDDDFEDVGEWVNGDIKFTRQGAKIHKSLRDTSADKIEWLSDKRPK